nr:hypothetical protein [Paracoccus mutanolyticus]
MDAISYCLEAYMARPWQTDYETIIPRPSSSLSCPRQRSCCCL